MEDLPTFNPKNHQMSSKNTDAPLEFNNAVFDPKAARESARRERMTRLDPLDAPLGLIPTTSFSSLSNFEKCPYHVYLSKVEKCPDVVWPRSITR